MIKKRVLKEKRLTPLRLLTASFLCNITVGTILLMLPVASRDGRSLGLLDALFTATSAGCVTGLAVVDTFNHFSTFGQVVILCLIQVGGLGFIAVSSLLLLVVGSRITLRERLLISESFSMLKVGGAVRLVRKVWIITMLCELLGAVSFATVFVPQFGWAQGLWFSVFHSVSAFCNAGFDLMGGGSLTAYSSNITVNVTVMLLILVGGLGFIVWEDLISNRLRFKKLTLHSKVVLTGSTILLLGGGIVFYLSEQNGAFAELSQGDKIMAGFFQAVTTRTAGFNTVDLNSFTTSGTVLNMVFMLIGAAPGSTGGGMKVTTVAVIVLFLLSYFGNRAGVNAFGRRIPDRAVQRAFNAVTIYAVAIIIGTFVIGLQGIGFELTLFEVISAVGTVGLSRGATAEYTELSKVMTILLMFAGRVGGLSVAIAVAERAPRVNIKNVEENIITG